MGLFICLFICNLFIPIIMIVGGYCMYKNPPKTINDVIGYRTKMSKKNMDTWNFAHHLCGKLWLIVGWIVLIPSVIIQIPFRNSGENAVGLVGGLVLAFQLVILLVSIIPVEKALKKTFDENGNRR